MKKRTYAQFCSIARALDLVGERWTLLVIRDLLVGPQRYTDLLNNLPGIGPNVLSARLKSLEELGAVERKALPPPAASTVYELTELGRGLEAVVLDLARWGHNFMDTPRPDEHQRLSWYMTGVRALFHPEDARGVHDTYEFDVDDARFNVRVDDGTIDVRQGAAETHDVLIRTDLDTLLAVGLGQLSAGDAVTSGRLSSSGDKRAIRRCLKLLTRGFPAQGQASASELEAVGAGDTG